MSTNSYHNSIPQDSIKFVNYYCLTCKSKFHIPSYVLTKFEICPFCAYETIQKLTDNETPDYFVSNKDKLQ